MDIKEILALSAKDKKHELRQVVTPWLLNHHFAIKKATGKTSGHMANNMHVADLIGLVTKIQANDDPVGWLNAYMGGGTATEEENDKPLLEGVSAENLLAIMLRIAYRSKRTDHDAIVNALRQTHRIHSSFEPVMASAELLFKDYKLDGSEGRDKLSERYENISLRVCPFTGLVLGEPEGKPSTTPKLKEPNEQTKTMIDALLSSQGLPLIGDLYARAKSSEALTTKIDELEEKLKKASSLSAKIAPTTSTPTHTASGKIPTFKQRLEKAYKVFGVGKARFDFEVLVWDWDEPNPNVPEIDPHYIFRPEELMRVLYALITNQRCYLFGDTGTGKTTLVEQVAARLRWMFKRVNFDSEISRFDLIGRETLTTDASGATISKFVDGILPQMMSAPFIGCFDEIDFCRADISYVMQSSLEGNGLVITEDGGRLVNPHSHFRMFATGNTQGQGDEKGLYQGARPQSMAFLDRFTVWGKVDYLKADDRRKLIERKCPSLNKTHVETICQYVTCLLYTSPSPRD